MSDANEDPRLLANKQKPLHPSDCPCLVCRVERIAAGPNQMTAELEGQIASLFKPTAADKLRFYYGDDPEPYEDEYPEDFMED